MDSGKRAWWLGLVVAAVAVVACDGGEGDDGDDGAMAGDTSAAGDCSRFEFEYAGMPEDNVCPQLECCPGQLDGNFSAFANGMCLSSANCDEVCEDPDAAFDCL